MHTIKNYIMTVHCLDLEAVEELNKVVLGVAGDDKMTRQITPRGKNFTKVQCEVEVQSVSMINCIYDELEKMERTVMRF